MADANNNKRLHDELVKAGKNVVIIRGYRYVRQSNTVLVPRFGKIAKKADYKCMAKVGKIPNPTQQFILDHGSYRIALEYLNGKYEGDDLIDTGKPIIEGVEA